MDGGAHYRRSPDGIMKARTVGGVQKDIAQGRKLEESMEGRPFMNFGWGYFIPNKSNLAKRFRVEPSQANYDPNRLKRNEQLITGQGAHMITSCNFSICDTTI